MRVLVCGGREYSDRERVFEVLDEIHINTPIDSIVSGTAKGADRLGEIWAAYRGVLVELYPAQWETYGKRAGTLRNIQMADTFPDLVVAFPGGRGTQHMITTAYERNIPVKRIEGKNK